MSFLQKTLHVDKTCICILPAKSTNLDFNIFSNISIFMGKHIQQAAKTLHLCPGHQGHWLGWTSGSVS
jgi:hypothetical protein